jgi:hypothetical protein
MMFTCTNYLRGCRGRTNQIHGFCPDCKTLGLTRSPAPSPHSSPYSSPRTSVCSATSYYFGSPHASPHNSAPSTPYPHDEEPLNPVAWSTRSRISSISSIGGFPSLLAFTFFMPSAISPDYSAMSSAFASLASASSSSPSSSGSQTQSGTSS